MNKSVIGLCIVVGFAICYTIIFSFISIGLFNNFELNARDLGIFDNVIWNTTQGRILYSDFFEGNFLSHHFIVTLVFPAIFYFFWKDPRMLLVFQSFTLALTIIPLYFIAKERLKDISLAVVFSVSFLFLYFLQQANLCDYHPNTMQPFIIACAFYAIIKNRYSWFFVFLGMLLIAKEDTFLYGLGFGLYILFSKRNKIVGISTLLISFVWGYCVLNLLIPYFGGLENNMMGVYYGWLGETPVEILKTMLTRPFYVISQLCTSLRIRSFIMIFLPVLFLPLFSRGALFLCLFPIAEMLLSSRQYAYSLAVHYAIPILPFVHICAIEGLCSLRRKTNPKFIKKIVSWRFFNVFLMFTLIGIGLYMTYTEGYYPFSKAYNKVDIVDKVHAEYGKEIIQLIPKNASIAAQNRLYPHVAHRNEVYLFQGLDNYPFNEKEVEYLLFDIHNTTFPITRRKLYKDIKTLLFDRKYGVVEWIDGYLLFKKGYTDIYNEKVFHDTFNVFHGEHKSKQTGRNRFDKNAVNKLARHAQMEDKKGFLVYGHYIVCEPGDYTIIFRLRGKTKDKSRLLATIDICTDRGETILVERDIYAAHMEDSSRYYEIPIDISLSETKEIEYRVLHQKGGEIWVDNVQIVGESFSLENT